MSGEVQNVGANSVNNNPSAPQGGNESAALNDSLASIFQKIDKNGDGRISEDEMQDNKELFKVIQNLVGKNLLGKAKDITLKRLQKLGNMAKALIVKDFLTKEANQAMIDRSKELARQSNELANMSTEELIAINEKRKAKDDEVLLAENEPKKSEEM